MDKFWMVWNPGASFPSVRHPARELATREAERLAANHVTDSFIVLEAVSVSRALRVSTEMLEEELTL
ncbi:MAG: hypothetical protein J0M07_28650 [Anaerolineae bacterium]|nr:hypothetical protein [Anaerolineae bacterium]